MSTAPGCVVERCGVKEITTSFLSYAVYDDSLGAAGLGGGAATGVTGEVRSNKLDAAAAGGEACGGAAEGAGESNRPRMSLAVAF